MFKRILGLTLLVLLALAGWGYVNLLADPVVRRASFALHDWPANTAPLRVALISDVHMQGPDMPPERVARIVAQVNAEHPDLILLAGDFIGDRMLGTRSYSDAEIAAPLGKLLAPLGTFAVLGNHDEWRDPAAMRKALSDVGIRVLDNQAVRAGVLTLAGAGDAATHHDDIAALGRAAAALPGPILLFAHSPDLVPKLPAAFALVLAGHTHCGQIMVPLRGSLASSSRYGDRYRCGVIREGGRAIVVTAGLGASVVPFRFGAPPDWWLLTLGGPQTPARQR